MQTIRTTKLAAIALTALAASTVTALAVDGVATGNVNVRTGPGTNYTKVDTLYKGEKIDIKECKSGWCYIEHSGPDGWVSGNYLAKVGSGGSSSSDPDVNFNVDIGPGGVSFGFGIGDSSISVSPPAPAAKKVCVYNGSGYTGASKCFPVGTTINSIPGYWNNRISSIKVEPGATITICNFPGFGGACATHTTNRPNLPFMNNKTSSLEVY